MKAVRITEQHFLEDDVVDGLVNYHRTDEYDWRCEDTIPGPSDNYAPVYSHEEAAAIIKRHGLAFEGDSEYATDPDGSFIADYATGRRVETTAALTGEWSSTERNLIRMIVLVS